MSAIQKELVKACGLDVAKYATRAALHAAIVAAVNEFKDAEWDAISAGAQDWFNDAADATKAKKAVAEFPDYKAEEPEPETRSRRRGAAAEEPETPAATETAVADLEEGMNVKVTFKKRGAEKSATGEVVEISKRKGFLVVKTADDEEVEIGFDTVTATEVFHGTASPDAGAEPVLAEGAEIEFETKRGKVITGLVKELKDDYVVLDNGDDYDRDASFEKTLKVLKAAPAAAAQEPEAPARGRRAAAEPEAGKGASTEDDKPKRSSNPKGVSVGGRIRELVANDLDMTEEAVGKVLTKEDIEFRPQTLKMIYGDCATFIKLLRDAGQLKKAK